METQNQITTGIILRGRLLGIRDTKKVYTDKSGNQQSSMFKELGIEAYAPDGYGGTRPFVHNVRISQEKEKDSAFIKSISDNHGLLVELPVLLGNFQSVYTDRNAFFTVLQEKTAS